MRLAENSLSSQSLRSPASQLLDEKALTRFGELGLAGRLLLTSDGSTVTNMLEQIAGEQIVTAQLDQSLTTVDKETKALMSFPAAGLVTRVTNLAGAATGKIYVRAKSALSMSAMPRVVRADLLGTDEPIGRLLRKHRVESFREILSIHVPERPFPLAPSRRYLIFIGGCPALLIEESFTAECFLLCPERSQR
jgi:beta-ribofuranosylaminobenzene 5'-phosphate synthase